MSTAMRTPADTGSAQWKQLVTAASMDSAVGGRQRGGSRCVRIEQSLKQPRAGPARLAKLKVAPPRDRGGVLRFVDAGRDALEQDRLVARRLGRMDQREVEPPGQFHGR